MPKQKIQERTKELVEHFEIGDWVDKRTEEYSQGMRQRETITAAFLHDPKQSSSTSRWLDSTRAAPAS